MSRTHCGTEEDLRMPFPRFRAALPMVTMLAALAPAAFAQGAREGAYDTPVLSPVDNGLYSVTLKVQAGPSGAPGGFAVQWMKRADFVAAGGWPTSPGDPRVGSGNFVGTPTLNLWGATTFKLEPGETALIQPGDLFDETGVGINANAGASLEPGTEYVTRAQALPGVDGTASDYAPAVQVQTLNGECTQGFWKNHPETWPAACLPLVLGTVSYTKAQLIQIFATPAQGNGLISLAHQLITAKLNLCNGSDPSVVAAFIASADALIGSLVVPPIGSGILAPSATSSLTESLDDYNNGRVGGVAECATMTRTSSTWGRVKLLYR
jgi:hypothetical protein